MKLKIETRIFYKCPHCNKEVQLPDCETPMTDHVDNATEETMKSGSESEERKNPVKKKVGRIIWSGQRCRIILILLSCSERPWE